MSAPLPTEAEILRWAGQLSNKGLDEVSPDGATQRHLAAQYGVSTSLVHAVVHRKVWRHI